MGNEKKRIVLLLLFSVVIGLLLVTQVRMPHGEKMYVSAKTLEDMQLQMDSEQESIRRTELQTEDEKKKLAEFEKLAASDGSEELIAGAKAELDYYKLTSGRTAVKGEGIRVTIADSDRELYEGESVNSLLVHDIDVLMIMNDLITAGAEAVSINGHRVIDMSAITCSGYTIRINGIFTANPFRIEAIGDPGRLYAAMLSPGSYGKEYLEQQISFQVVAVEELSLPAYPYAPSYQHMTITKEGESN